MSAFAAGMAEGGTYRIRYRFHGQRYDRMLVGVYLGAAQGVLSFSCRPAAGTQQIPESVILSGARVDGLGLSPCVNARWPEGRSA
jgi:hypothetical protein